MKPVPVAELRTFVLQVLETCGLSRADAETTADVLVTTDTWGVFTHGTKALYAYTRRLRAGGLKADGRPRVDREGPGWAVVDGDSAIGMVTAVYAMRLAMAKAAQAGIALVAVHNTCHFGAAGYYASQAADEGKLAIVVSNDVPSVAAPGSRGPVLGSNPFAFGAPGGSEGPMVLDISTAEVAGGKVAAAAAEGKRIPESWLVDSEGRPAGDPNLFLQGKASLAPMAGHKGYGLALMIEILSGALSGSSMRNEVGIWMREPLGKPTGHGQAFLAIDPAVFLGTERFTSRMEELFGSIRSGPSVAGVDHVKIPGEIERDKRQRSLSHGIDFPDEVLKLLHVAAEENNCPVPSFLGQA
ncbi:MAG TPA: Ldh family oxidoreductase [Opitutaceae bacterium]|jgi:LDH2 family malate/lactate/ureidoglycolate dehydrogenase